MTSKYWTLYLIAVLLLASACNNAQSPQSFTLRPNAKDAEQPARTTPSKPTPRPHEGHTENLTDTIESVDVVRRTLTFAPGEFSARTEFLIGTETTIKDNNGKAITLGELAVGDKVFVRAVVPDFASTQQPLLALVVLRTGSWQTKGGIIKNIDAANQEITVVDSYFFNPLPETLRLIPETEIRRGKSEESRRLATFDDLMIGDDAASILEIKYGSAWVAVAIDVITRR